jgi:hypothetical protein
MCNSNTIINERMITFANILLACFYHSSATYILMRELSFS